MWYDGVQAGEIVLRDEVTVDRRSDASVLMRWKYCIEDPAALFMIARRSRSGRFDRLGVSYRVVGRGGPARVNISQPEMPLYEFLRTFGVAPEELETYLDYDTQHHSFRIALRGGRGAGPVAGFVPRTAGRARPPAPRCV